MQTYSYMKIYRLFILVYSGRQPEEMSPGLLFYRSLKQKMFTARDLLVLMWNDAKRKVAMSYILTVSHNSGFFEENNEKLQSG
jgi:hypothetical protein